MSNAVSIRSAAQSEKLLFFSSKGSVFNILSTA
jgi:hypothetical protein